MFLLADTRIDESIDSMTAAPQHQDDWLAAIASGRSHIHQVPRAQRTPEICKASVDHDPWSVLFLGADERTAEVCAVAVSKTGWPILALSDAQRTPSLVRAAMLRISGLSGLSDQADRSDEDVALDAIHTDGWAVQALPRAQRTAAMRHAGMLQLAGLPRDSATTFSEAAILALNKDGSAIALIEPQMADEHLLEFISANWDDLSQRIESEAEMNEFAKAVAAFEAGAAHEDRPRPRGS